MKLSKIYHSPVSRLLIVYFAGLLISVSIIRFVEYQQARDDQNRPGAMLFRQEIVSSKVSRTSYRSLIRASREEVVFDELDRVNKETNSLRGSLFFLHYSQSPEKQGNVLYFTHSSIHR
jgi:hypothetical protein